MVGPETAIREIGVTGASVLVLAEWRGTAVILIPVQPVCALRRHAHHLFRRPSGREVSEE
jgi:hypothetical protein